MANALYRKLPTGEWMRQDGGGPVFLKIARDSTDGNWYPTFTYNGSSWFYFVPVVPLATPAAAQTALNNYVGQLNAGTA